MKLAIEIESPRYRLIPASAEDQPWLERLRRAVYQELFAATWGSWDEARHNRQVAECWQRGHIYIVELDGVRVGMFQLFEHAGVVEIGEIQVQPSHQRLGIGTRLLLDTVARAHAEQRKVCLSSGLQNHRAIRLYERLGFQHVSRSETHVHMECRFAGSWVHEPGEFCRVMGPLLT